MVSLIILNAETLSFPLLEMIYNVWLFADNSNTSTSECLFTQKSPSILFNFKSIRWFVLFLCVFHFSKFDWCLILNTIFTTSRFHSRFTFALNMIIFYSFDVQHQRRLLFDSKDTSKKKRSDYEAVISTTLPRSVGQNLRKISFERFSLPKILIRNFLF